LKCAPGGLPPASNLDCFFTVIAGHHAETPGPELS
jgi:hypothetical protein